MRVVYLGRCVLGWRRPPLRWVGGWGRVAAPSRALGALPLRRGRAPTPQSGRGLRRPFLSAGACKYHNGIERKTRRNITNKQTPAPFQPASAPAKICRGHTQAGGRESGWGRQSPAPFLCGGSCRPRLPLMPLPSFCLRKPPPKFVGGNRRQRARAVVGAGCRQPLYFAGAHAARAPL